jgi:hypothetical protein
MTRFLSARFLPFVVVLAFFSPLASSQSSKIPVYIDGHTPDNIGQLLAYEVREEIGGSSHLDSAPTESASFFQLRIMSIDPYASEGSQNSNPTTTEFSVVLTGSLLKRGLQVTFYIEHWVGHCGEAIVKSCAAKIVAAADADMTMIMQGSVSQGPSPTPAGKK